MSKLNNKGQTLVAFIIFIPILLMLFTLVIDLGLMSIEKRNISNNIKYTIKYGLKHISESDNYDKMDTILSKNIKDSNSDIIINNNYIKITVRKKYKRLFKILSKDDYDFTVSYSGTIANGKIVINKE